MNLWARLSEELDRWNANGLQARLWWRDDDVTAVTPALERLIRNAQETDVVVGLAVIPHIATPELVEFVRDARAVVWQHGWTHTNHEGPTGSRVAGEFGFCRAADNAHLLEADARAGQKRLDQLFGPDRWQRVFVPPYHGMSLAFKAQLPRLGYIGFSAGHPLTPPGAIREHNAHIDIMNWGRREFAGEQVVIAQLLDQLQGRRFGLVATDSPVGLLTHHPALDDGAWAFLSRFLATIQEHPAAELCAADELFS